MSLLWFFSGLYIGGGDDDIDDGEEESHYDRLLSRAMDVVVKSDMVGKEDLFHLSQVRSSGCDLSIVVVVVVEGI